jgi:hypothetical protein
MDERERERGRLSPEIFVYATNKNFLNVYDALRIEKIKIEIAGYDQATGKQTGLAGAWLDVDDMRLLAHLVTTRLFKDVLANGGRAPRFEKFGGSERDGAVESRTLVIEWDPGEGNRFAGYPYRMTISNGPGQRNANGAVQPKGEPASKQSMRLPEADLMKILLAVQAYIQAYETAHHHRLAATKLRELEAKMAERAANAPSAPRPAAAARPAAPAAAPLSAPTPRPTAPPLAPTPAPAAASSAPPLRVVRDNDPTPVAPRSAPPPATRPAVAGAARPVASTVGSPTPVSRPQPQMAGNTALAAEPELDMDAPPVRSARPAPASAERPGATRATPAAGPTPAARATRPRS